MKIKYKLSTGEIISMGEMPNLEASDGEGVMDTDLPIPSDLSELKVKDGEVKEKTVKEKKDMKDDREGKKENRKNAKIAILSKLKITEDELDILLGK